jgi:hypothetical protein
MGTEFNKWRAINVYRVYARNVYRCAHKVYTECAHKTYAGCAQGMYTGCAYETYTGCAHTMYTACAYETYTGCTHEMYTACAHKVYTGCAHEMYTACAHKVYTVCAHEMYTACAHGAYARCAYWSTPFYCNMAHELKGTGIKTKRIWAGWVIQFLRPALHICWTSRLASCVAFSLDTLYVARKKADHSRYPSWRKTRHRKQERNSNKMIQVPQGTAKSGSYQGTAATPTAMTALVYFATTGTTVWHSVPKRDFPELSETRWSWKCPSGDTRLHASLPRCHLAQTQFTPGLTV